jgi:hypothetical protein
MASSISLGLLIVVFTILLLYRMRRLNPKIARYYRSETLATPHSKERALNRDVIKPQEAHIFCDP